jgi:hypothetical protein
MRARKSDPGTRRGGSLEGIPTADCRARHRVTVARHREAALAVPRKVAGSRLRKIALAALCLAFALDCSGCVPEFLKRRPVSKSNEETPPQPAFTGTGLKVSARFPAGREEIEKRFKKFLPDSGIVPVEVSLRNESGGPLNIHSANGLPLPPPFDGVTLAKEGECYPPLSPLDVLTVLIGESKALRYRRPGLFGVVAGVTAVQPLALVFAHGELSVGRYHRALVKNSLYPVRKSGILEPLALEPDGEAQGFLFFLIPAGEDPYAGEGAGEGGGVSWELRFQPAESAYVDLDPLDVCDVRSARIEVPSPAARAGMRGGVEPPFFALRCASRRSKGGLLVGYVQDVEEGGGEKLAELAGFGSRSARIADASMLGGYAACALNFKSRSRIYLIGLDGAFSLEGTADLERSVVGIRLARAGLFVVTVDGVCRLFSLEGLEETRSERFGPGIGGLYLDGDRLVVAKDGQISIYGTDGYSLLKPIDRIPVPEVERKILFRSADGVIFAHASKGAGGDTLVVVDPSAFSERGRMVLPGEISYACETGGMMLQIEEGTILRVRFVSKDRSFRIERAGYLPFRVGAMRSDNGTFTAIGTEGRVVKGDLSPREIAPFTVKVALNPAER